MESTEDDDDLQLMQASSSLLADLEAALPKILWKVSRSGNARKVHTQVRRRDLDHVTRLIEPFQSEPQLLDARLKHIVPPIVDAYLAHIQQPVVRGPSAHLDLQTAVCILLYTLCKVRGYKVILGFLSNEPRFLEPILARIEAALSAGDEEKPEWQAPYVLLLWLSHLLLTPFDLASISTRADAEDAGKHAEWPQDLPPVVLRILTVGHQYLPSSTKAQDAAAMLLVRLVKRPDMQKLHLADTVAAKAFNALEDDSTAAMFKVYERPGPLRLLSGMAASPEPGHLVRDIYKVCVRLSEDDSSIVATNAVAKKLAVKIFRNTAILCLRASPAQEPLLRFFETTSVLEDVIDYMLRSLADRDTPVRFAAAKAISLIILELEPEMREEVIQAVLDTFKEDMPRSTGETVDFRTANALKWHGLTLCLAHTLFKRSASPSQLPDIVRALTSALQFEQRTSTGSSIGTNVRDAANFGVWSLSRRYTTKELLSVDIEAVSFTPNVSTTESVIQHVAIELVLSACLDPAGNIRRGSSAALQELVGRHPNQVAEGIALVQTVDYQAVGLRRRAIVDVAVRTTELDSTYFKPVQMALFGWRGLGSADSISREAAAMSLAQLATQDGNNDVKVATEVLQHAAATPPNEYELLHGLASTLAFVFEKARARDTGYALMVSQPELAGSQFAALLKTLDASTEDFSARLLRSELPCAIAKLVAAFCSLHTPGPDRHGELDVQAVHFESIELLTDRLLARGDEAIREAVSTLARSLLDAKRRAGRQLGNLASTTLMKHVAIDGAKSVLNGAGRAMTLGALAPLYDDGLSDDKAAAIAKTLGGLTEAMNVDWRIIGIRALQLAVDGCEDSSDVGRAVLAEIVKAVHRGLNDYTIDERGDIGSLVRLQAITCTSTIFSKLASDQSSLHEEPLQTLHADIPRLSLEKLDRVRLAAAQCQSQHIIPSLTASDIAAVSSTQYFTKQLAPLASPTAPEWKNCALLEGIISAAGISSEQLLQPSRLALAQTLTTTTNDQLHHLLTLYTSILKTSLAKPTSPLTTPALSLLAYLLGTRIPYRLASTPFKWLNLLSAVQKSHHKSNDISKIAAAVSVYRGLAEVDVIRQEVLKKLLGMLKTNPYPRVRMGVAEMLFVVVGEKEGREVREVLMGRNWMGERKGNEGAVKRLEGRLLMSR